MSNETKIGILAVVAIGLVLWGYKFIQGENLFSSSLLLYAEYENVDQLGSSSPIFVSGYQVGSVQSIYLNPDNLKTVIVEMNIEKDLPLPKNTRAEIVTSSFLGEKAIKLRFDGPCGEGNPCAESGDYIQGEVTGMLASVIGEAEEIQKYVDVLTGGLNSLLDTVGKEASAEIADVKATLKNLRSTSEELNRLVAVRANRILQDVEVITSSVSKKGHEIESIIANMDTLTNELAQLQLAQQVDKTFANTNAAVNNLNTTLSSADSTVKILNGVLAAVQNGEGTLGQLIQDEQLYSNLSRTTKNLDLLLQDFRLNPKRYVNVSVFGKKDKEYKVPEEDPAFPEGEDSTNTNDDDSQN